MDLSVILVNYNTLSLTKKCLSSVFKSEFDGVFEVIVSDNGSTDGSIEMIRSEFPKASLILNGANLGFSKANNVAIKQAKGRNILLLNTDTEIAPDTLKVCVSFIDQNEHVGALGCKVLLPDGKLDPACRRRFPNPVNSFLRLFGLKKFSDYNIQGPIYATLEVDAVMGAFMMVKRSVIDKVGMLDEDYFMYGEDLDWCLRIKQAGYSVVYYPKTSITHYKYGSSQAKPYATIRMSHDAMRIFYSKHYARGHSAAFNLLVSLGISLRMQAVMLQNLFKAKKSVH